MTKKEIVDALQLELAGLRRQLASELDARESVYDTHERIKAANAQLMSVLGEARLCEVERQPAADSF